jgi:hypothetical protein
MRKFVIGLAASIFITTSAATANAQVTGIRHSDGSWTFVDANGRDIHADNYAGRSAQHGHRRTHHDVATSGRYRERGYLPWQAR